MKKSMMLLFGSAVVATGLVAVLLSGNDDHDVASRDCQTYEGTDPIVTSGRPEKAGYTQQFALPFGQTMFCKP